MRVRQATSRDMERIMEIEENAFIPYIRETYLTFDSRMKTFGKGFLVLEEDNGTVQGYFSSELWQELPHDNKVFILDHDIAKVHRNDGQVLYISSFAIMSSLRGRGLGVRFLKECLAFCLEVISYLCHLGETLCHYSVSIRRRESKSRESGQDHSDYGKENSYRSKSYLMAHLPASFLYVPVFSV